MMYRAGRQNESAGSSFSLITKAMAELHKAVPLDPSRSKEPFVFIKIEAFVQQLTVKDHEGNIG